MTKVVADRFEIVREAGSGGMGVVYEARDRRTGVTVAVKVLGDRAHASRFTREAELLAGLEHDAIVSYVDHGDDGQAPYLAMEWLDGEDLAQRLAQGPLSVEETIAVGARVADAIGLAHRRGVVHRDLKPSNVFLVGRRVDRAKVLDFGLARDLAATTNRPLTVVGAIMGSVGYLSPEQARGAANVDARSDVFAMGCILFECLTGKPAFSGAHAVAILAKLLVEDAPRVRSLEPNVPRALDALVASMLERNPEARPPNAGAVRDALLRIAQASSVPSLAPSAGARAAALTRDEQRVMSVILVGEKRALADTLTNVSTTSSAAATVITLRTEDARASIDATVARFDAAADVAADGTTIVTLRGGAATDQATRAARCAIALRAVCPGAAIALAIGRGLAEGASASGEVIERAAALFATASRDPNEAIHVEASVVPMLQSRFIVAPGASGTLLHGERQSFESARVVLGRVTPFVGRARELAMLENAFASTIVEPQASAALVIGGAGSGKSRLREELVRSAKRREPTTVVWMVQGDPLRTQPYAALAATLRAVTEIDEMQGDAARQALASRVAEVVLDASQREDTTLFLAEIIGAPFDDAASTQLRLARESRQLMQDQVARAWTTFVSAHLDRAPLLLVLEDIHWIDAASVQLVDATLAAHRERPVMALGLGRPEVEGAFPKLWADHGMQISRLAPLSARAAEKLAREALAGTRVDDAAITRAVERAAGNPFVLEELVRALAERPADDATLPDGVLALVQLRLEALEPALRRVLRAASIFGRTAREEGVAHLLGDDDAVALVRASLETLVAREVLEFLKEDARVVRFRHDLVRDAAYAMLTEADRSVGHALAGEWLETAGEHDASMLAMHFELGGDPARAAGWYARAAEQALDGSDMPAAHAHANRALERGVTGELRGKALYARAIATRWSGELVAGLDDAREAMAMFEPGTAPWFAAVLQACLLGDSGGRRDVVRDLVAATLPTTPRDARSRALRIRVMGEGAIASHHAGDHSAGDALMKRVEEEAAPLMSDPSVALTVYRMRAANAGNDGDPWAELHHWVEIGKCYDQIGDRGLSTTAKVNIGYGWMMVGAYDRAEESLRVAIKSADALHLKRMVAAAQHNLGLVLACRGDFAQAVSVEREAVDTMAAVGDDRMLAMCWIYLAMIHDMAGDRERAESVAREALESSKSLPPLRARALAILARALLRLGRVAEAESISDEAMVAMVTARAEGGDVFQRLVRAETLFACGRADEARSLLHDAKRTITRAAACIREDAVREQFVAAVPENAAVLALCREHGVD